LLSGAHRVLLTAAGIGLVPGRAPGIRSLLETLSLGLVMGALCLWAWIADSSPFFAIAVGVAVLGWVPVQGAAFRGPVFRWAIACIGATLVTHAVFFGEDRYHVVVTPMLCLLAVGAFRTHAERASNVPHSRV
jgi:hypothetical protein